MSTQQQTKLLRLLETFSAEELRDFKKYLQSPFFNARPECLRLLNALLPGLKSGRTPPEKAALFCRVFPERPFDDHRLRMTMSFLYRQACEYLAIRDFRHRESAFSARQAEVLLQRKQVTAARRHLENALGTLEQSRFENADFLETSYQLYLQAYRQHMAGGEMPDFDLQLLSDRLDEAYLSRKLWQSCFLLSRQIMGKGAYRFDYLEQLIGQLDERSLQQPAIAIYYHCYRSLTRPEAFSNYLHFKKALLEHGHRFPTEELRDLYILAVNFCIRQYNAGNQAFLREQFDLYQEGLDQGYFLVDGELSRYTYQNAATVALVLHELKWLETFIDAYRQYLHPDHRESTYRFNKARLDYTRGDHGTALVELQKTAFRDIHLGLAARILQLKIYFELREFNLLESHLAALRTFLQRKKEFGYHRENYMNTLRFTQRLLDSNPFDKAARAALRQEIEGTKVLAEKEWLLAQIA